jgi:hypothetical protein
MRVLLQTPQSSTLLQQQVTMRWQRHCQLLGLANSSRTSSRQKAYRLGLQLRMLQATSAALCM